MLEKLKHIQYKAAKHITVVGVHFSGAQTRYALLVLKKLGDTISVVSEERDVALASIEMQSKNHPFLVAFTGKGIISKKVVNKGNYLKEILFNAPLDAFYIYEAREAQHHFVSVARKEMINETLATFRAFGHHILDYSIGPFVGQRLAPLFQEEKITVSDYELIFSGETLTNFEKSTEVKSYTIGESTLHSDSTVALGLVMQYLYPSETIHYDLADFALAKETFKFKKRFSILGGSMLVFFLLALLISYLLKGHYDARFLSYTAELDYLNATYEKVKELQEEEKRKLAVLNESGMLSDSFLSKYIFDIGASVPASISLTSIDLNPLGNRLKQGEKIVLATNEIMISGETTSSVRYRDWFNKLSALSWVKKIETLTLKTNRKQVRLFTLKITL